MDIVVTSYFRTSKRIFRVLMQAVLGFGPALVAQAAEYNIFVDEAVHDTVRFRNVGAD